MHTVRICSAANALPGAKATELGQAIVKLADEKNLSDWQERNHRDATFADTFESVIASAEHKATFDLLLEMFEKYDRSHDGQIDRQELLVMLQVDMKQNKALANQFTPGSKPDLFAQYDKTHDGNITFWEFCGLFVDLASRDSFAEDKSKTTATNVQAWRNAKKRRETKNHTDDHGHTDLDFEYKEFYTNPFDPDRVQDCAIMEATINAAKEKESKDKASQHTGPTSRDSVTVEDPSDVSAQKLLFLCLSLRFYGTDYSFFLPAVRW